MSSPRTDKREQIRQALVDAGIEAYPYWPESFVPPIALVGPDPDRYQTFDGASYGAVIVNFAVTLIAAAGVNDEAAGEIDDLIDQAYTALCPLEGFEVGDLRTGNIEGRLAASIAVSTEVRHEEYP